MPKPVTKVEPSPALEKRTRRVLTPEYKLSIMQQAEACKHGEQGELLRREKLYSNQLSQWRREFAEQGVAGLSKSTSGPASKHTARCLSTLCQRTLIRTPSTKELTSPP